jgi:hypothetical protein
MLLAEGEHVLLCAEHLVLDQSPYQRLMKRLHYQRRPEADLFHSFSFLLVFFDFRNSTSLSEGKRQRQSNITFSQAIVNGKHDRCLPA